MYKAILFDLDGTLTDPKQGITRAVQYALAKYKIIEDNLDLLEPFIGPPLASSFEERYGFSASEARTAVDYYREYFADKGIYENELYGGIRELLELLVEQKRTIIVATSKPTVFAEKIVSYFRIDSYFDYVCGSNLDGTMSDKGEIIAHILQSQQLTAASAIMIGDRKHDLIGAQRNGVASIGVGYGYGSEEELQAHSPAYYVRNVRELHELFQDATAV
ncbi:HAD hydrolase-like protein [Paenibacillus sp. CF384]|uniref:HAD hydrolase-like protein n=1 Tax=Paenibacillus sp. CF384 TaxID=1884382 RepID=UPI000895B0D8|nr:HAD hydrolase-like protein [Paenibacillus sp. CF384]SDW19202.1 phosphoglycolate phosphatase [Paenibacillus sp. CF384]